MTTEAFNAAITGNPTATVIWVMGLVWCLSILLARLEVWIMESEGVQGRDERDAGVKLP